MNTKNELPVWQADQSQPYFYYDADDCCFQYFSTEKERDEKANEAIQHYVFDYEWNEEVKNIVCGTLTGRATMVDITPIDEEVYAFEFDMEEHDYTCNYVIKPLDHVEPNK